MLKRIRKIGPGALIAAAFIGPGTVTTSTLAGANFGYALLWALLFATVATIVLQEMSARLGLITQQGLGETLAKLLRTSPVRWPLIVLVGLALYLGNAAYEAGNLSGAALGIATVAGDSETIFSGSVIGLALLAAVLLVGGSYKQIETVLLGLVAVMAIAFVAVFVVVHPLLGEVAKGLLSPSIPEGSLLTVLALIGTTIVPYNLFLHASAVRSKWSSPDDLAEVRTDTILSIGLGGLIAILIAATAAGSLFAAGLEVSNAADMAMQLEPLFGPHSKYFLGIGLFAAGLTSSITAPLATAFAMTEILGLDRSQSSREFRFIALSVIAVGAGLSLTGIRPIEIIITAQFANGLLLPVIAAFLLYAMNQSAILGRYTNGWIANIAGIGVVLVAAGLGLRLIVNAVI